MTLIRNSVQFTLVYTSLRNKRAVQQQQRRKRSPKPQFDLSTGSVDGNNYDQKQICVQGQECKKTQNINDNRFTINIQNYPTKGHQDLGK